MKILHVCNYFSFDMGYQDNLLPIGHKNIGNEVVIYASDRECKYNHNINSRIVKPGIYNYHGIKLIRGKIFFEIVNRFVVFKNLYNSLNQEKPDFIFHRGITSPSVFTVIKYKKKHRNCKLVFCVHADYNNSMQRKIMKIYHSFWGIIWKNMIKFTDKIFYVAPECKKFIINIYKIPGDKLEHLPLGGDITTLEKHDYFRKKYRDRYRILEDEIVFIHTGKLPQKKKTELVIEAFNRIKDKKIILLIIGNIEESYKDEFSRIIKNNKIIYTGWKNADEIHKIFHAGDVLLQPGSLSSVFAEGICCGLPVILGDTLQGEYLISYGNGVIIKDVTIESLVFQIKELINNPDKIKEMSKRSVIFAKKELSYDRLAERSLD